MIAQVLADWSAWNGVEPVSFSIVARIQGWARVVAGGIALVTFWLLWRLVKS